MAIFSQTTEFKKLKGMNRLWGNLQNSSSGYNSAESRVFAELSRAQSILESYASRGGASSSVTPRCAGPNAESGLRSGGLR